MLRLKELRVWQGLIFNDIKKKKTAPTDKRQRIKGMPGLVSTDLCCYKQIPVLFREYEQRARVRESMAHKLAVQIWVSFIEEKGFRGVHGLGISMVLAVFSAAGTRRSFAFQLRCGLYLVWEQKYIGHACFLLVCFFFFFFSQKLCGIFKHLYTVSDLAFSNINDSACH